jgi:hypothetical protein
MEIVMINVQSSNVASIGYSIEEKILRIKFNYGGIYDYINVPAYVYQLMLVAPSKGKFINQELKGKYQFKKIN